MIQHSNRRRFLPILYKLLISNLALVIIPIIVIGCYAYISSARSVEEHTRNNLEVAVSQIQSNVEYRVGEIIRSSDEIYQDQGLSTLLSGYYLDWEKYQVTTQYVMPRLESATNLPKSKIKLSLYLHAPTISEFYYNETEQSLIAGERQYEILHTSRIVDKAWYQNLRIGYDEMKWQQIENDAEYGYISLLRHAINYETFQSIGLIRASVKLKDIFEDVDFNQLGEGTKLFVLDQDEQLLYSSSPGGSLPYTAEELNESRDYLKISKPIHNIPVQIVALVPNASFKDNSQKVRNVTIIICAISILVMTLVSFIMARMFSSRLSKLVVSLEAFKEGELQRRIQYTGNDEFAIIAESFNEMASTTEQLIDEVYTSKLEKKEAELQILHSKINPHFLYNTFSSISRMAKLGEIDKLHEMIRALAKFYRLTLNKGEMLIQVEKELHIVRTYLDIQNIKYAERIHYQLEAEPETLGLETVKFILQPFVENVLEHAWYDDEIKIHIKVKKQAEHVHIEVHDNGLGMKQEIIDAIFTEGAGGIGYGIRNVDQRIKLHYGKDYGVSIRSEVGTGTVVTIVFPIKSPPSRQE
ncbi:sensor histidine kinase [Paenibacillus sp. LK1]|uniref:sensor histidine kinase n=1 Tax=Paenibacillus sp. LK1 TaxID=2053014 RepID=UPI00211E4996|nr:sensor histidine kinase [Paenibacillus sp. LK1]